jgi:hypothetical protein
MTTPPSRLIQSLLLLVTFVVAGCATKDPYHTLGWKLENCAEPSASECGLSYFQEHPDYDLAFAEFTERGNAFNNQWIEDILDRIRARQREGGVVVVTFVHGWKHNAAETDPNLIDFKKALTVIGKGSETLRNRRLVGVYIGWRGASLDLPGVENLTFWDRKSVAEEVGAGGVTKLLLDLDQIDQKQRQNVLVVVGHSFGGAIVVSAVSEILTERAIGRDGQGDSKVPIGDAVILLNPAIEANRVLNLVEAALSENYTPNQNPMLISISTDADWATHNSFPIGQSLDLLLTWHQLDLERTYYTDRLSGEHLVLKEEHLDTTTVGNFAPFLTHRLNLDDVDGQPSLNLQTCDQTPEGCVPRGRTTLSGHPTFGPLPDHYPLYFIKTDASIMTGHNDIFNPVVRAFILTLIDDIVRRAPLPVVGVVPEKPELAPGTVLSNPEKLDDRFQKFFSLQTDQE